MIKLVLCDMDGTLLPFGRSSVSERTMSAIYKLRSAGIDFGPASGREAVDLRRFFHGDESCFDSGIMANGKVISLHGQRLRTIYLDHDALVRLGLFARDGDGTLLNVYIPAYDAEGRDVSKIGFFGVGREAFEAAKRDSGLEVLGEVIDSMPREEIITAGFMCMGANGMDAVSQATALRPQLMELCPEFDFLRPAPSFFDVLPHAWTKASALSVFEEEVGISRDEMAFFGDSENDVALLEAIPNSFAVGNAIPAAQRAARYHIADAADDSVAIVMESIARHGGELVIPAEVSRDW